MSYLRLNGLLLNFPSVGFSTIGLGIFYPSSQPEHSRSKLRIRDAFSSFAYNLNIARCDRGFTQNLSGLRLWMHPNLQRAYCWQF